MIPRTIQLSWLLCTLTKLTWAQALPSDLPPVLESPSNATQSEQATGIGADSTENQARMEARDRFATGLRLYEDGEFALALIEFNRAYSLVPEYRVLYNIGQVNLQLGRYARAVRSLRQYLDEGRDRIPLDRQQSVSSDLKMLASRTANILVKVNVTDAEVLLDSDIVAVTPMTVPVLVDAGEHRLTVRKPGYFAQTKPLALAGNDNTEFEITLLPEPKNITTEKTVIVERKTAPLVEVADHRKLYLLLGWSTVGLLGAGWATTGYLGYESAQDHDDALNTKTSEKALNNLETRTQHWYLASDILGATTILAAGAMLYYTIAAPGTPSRTEQKVRNKTGWSLGASPRQITLVGSF